MIADSAPYELWPEWRPNPKAADTLATAEAAWRDDMTFAALAKVLDDRGHQTLRSRKPFTAANVLPVIIAIELLRGSSGP